MSEIHHHRHTREDLQDVLDDSGPEAVAETIARLAELSPIEYDKCREREAERLGVRVTTLDSQVKKARANGTDSTAQGTAILFNEPEPWPEPVDGAALLDSLTETFARYLALPAGAADALALWAMHTHLYDVCEHTPRLNISAPQKQCGKSLLLDVLEIVIARGLKAENLSTAVLFRVVDRDSPTLLIDEHDTFLKDNEDLRGALNAGHKRGSKHLRCEGDAHEVRAFNTFAPVALAGIGNLPGTLADRSITIKMQRAKPGEVKQRFDARKADNTLKGQLMRWAADTRCVLADAEPTLPDGMFNRRADNWRPLFAIAEAVGGEWPLRTRKAAEALTDDGDANESAGVLLLADIHEIFAARGTDRIRSTDLVEALIAMEERPWPEYRRGKPITTRQLANLLRPFGIVRGTRREGRDTFKGYSLDQFDDAFSRYLADQSVTRSQPAPRRHFDDSQSVTNGERVTDPKSPEPAPYGRCDRVTDCNGGCLHQWSIPSYTIIRNGGHCPACDDEGCKWCRSGLSNHGGN